MRQLISSNLTEKLGFIGTLARKCNEEKLEVEDDNGVVIASDCIESSCDDMI